MFAPDGRVTIRCFFVDQDIFVNHAWCNMCVYTN